MGGRLPPNSETPLSSPSLLCFSVFPLILSRKGKPINIYEASAAKRLVSEFVGIKSTVEVVEMQIPGPPPLGFSLSMTEVEPRKLHFKESATVIPKGIPN